MQLPFTVTQFFDVFGPYNLAVWPLQVVLFGLAVVAVAWVVFAHRSAGVGVSIILAVLWAWLGFAYHLNFFVSINPLAYAFAALSVVGALMFLWHGVVRRKLVFRLRRDATSLIGVLLMVFALVLYPAWSRYAGHHYPAIPTFGLPCPTTIFTIGLLALLVRPYPRAILAIPVIWSFIGGQAAFLLNVPQDIGLLFAGAIGIWLIARAPKTSEAA